MSYRCRSLITAVLLVGLLAPAAFAGWWDDLDKGEIARLSDLIAQPDRYRGQDVSFYCVFHQVDDVYNPLTTPFNAERYENLAVWADGAPVWENESFRHDYPFLYLRKANPQYAQLANLAPFTRIEVTGRIRAIHRAMPFIEVLSFRPTQHRVGKLVVQSVMAGDRYAEAGDDELAYENYKRALRPDLPPSYELLIRKRVAEGLRRLGKVAEANALEGGPILANSTAPAARGAGGFAPEPDPTMPFPAPGAGQRPGQPCDPTSPISSDFPGQPAGAPPSFPPAATGPSAPGILPAPPPTAIADDLPGVPAGPAAPLTEDLPGQPAGAGDRSVGGEGDRRDVPMPRATPPSIDDRPAPPSTGRLPGAPPRRAPRLTGAK